MGSLVFVNVPAKDLQKSRDFYRQLFGVDFARSLTHARESYHIPVADNLVNLLITPRVIAQEPIVCYFAVDDLDTALANVTRLGGKKEVDKFDIPVAPEAVQVYEDAVKRRGGPGLHARSGGTHVMGQALIVSDPDGNHFGLVQLEDHARAFYKLGHSAKAKKATLDEHNQAIAHGKAFEAKVKKRPNP